MRYRELGTTGCNISRVIMGCGDFGGVGSDPAAIGKGRSERAAFRLLDIAWDLGINTLDTANSYACGRSEEIIGRWLKNKRSCVRSRLMVTTKVGRRVRGGPYGWGLSRRHILAEIEGSLRRLGSDYIDLYLMHCPDPRTPIDETIAVLDELVAKGTIRYFGLSNTPAWHVAEALRTSEAGGLRRFDWIQNSFSLLERSDAREMFPLCVNQSLGYTAYSPLAGGWLSGVYQSDERYPKRSRMAQRPELYRKYRDEAIFVSLSRLRVLARRRQTSMAAMALNWVLSQPAVTAAVVGPGRPAHFDSIVKALEMTQGGEDQRAIAAIFAGAAAQGSLKQAI